MKTKFPVIYFVPLAILLADITFVSAAVYTERYVPALIGCGIAGALILIMMIVSLVYSKNSLRHFSKMNTHLETSAAQYMHTLPAPVAIIDDSRDIVWYNQVFAEKISLGSDAYGRSFGDFVQLDLDSLLTDGFAYCHVNGSVYKVVSEEFKEKDISFSIIHFSDETSYFNLRKRFDEEHPNVVILSIDNYDEIMQNAKESEKALASVETEQLIEKFMSSTNGFIKKISSNTFYAVIENRHLEEKITNKYKILDMPRNIKIACKYPLTFSIRV